MMMKFFYSNISSCFIYTFLILTYNVNIISEGKYFISNTLIFIARAFCTYHQNIPMHTQVGNFDLYILLKASLFEMSVPSFIALIWKFFPIYFTLKGQNLIADWVF